LAHVVEHFSYVLDTCIFPLVELIVGVIIPYWF